jgi:hypothetical protein
LFSLNVKSLFYKAIAAVIPMLAIVCLALVIGLLFPGHASAAQITPINAGLYALNVQMSQDAPQADQPFDILVMPQESSLRLTGQVVEMPVSGTDAANVYIPLVPQSGHANVLKGDLHIPIRGFWNIVLELNGPRGHGSATIPVVVSAPGAMPIWLAWSIGSLPAFGLLGWILRQRLYQNTLVIQTERI